MKNLRLILIVFLFLQLNLPAQEGWFWQNPLPSGNPLNDVFMIDENNAVAVGPNGRIIRTINGGIDWFERPSGTTYDLYSIQFTDENTGWINGYDIWSGGKLLKTTNGGEDWVAVLNTTFILRSFHFINNYTGWLICRVQTSPIIYKIFKTTNGGYDWIEISIIPANGGSKVLFVDDSTGFLTHPFSRFTYGIAKTTDEGETWAPVFEVGGYISSMCFTDNLTGWISVAEDVMQNSGVFSTTDGGDTWIKQNDFYLPTTVCFLDNQTGWVVNVLGKIIKTTDGGLSWIDQSINSTVILNSVHCIDNNIGCIVGAGGIILTTTNGGEEWINQTRSVTMNDLRSICFVDDNTGWAVGGDIIIKTTNGGEDWVEQSPDSCMYFNAVHFIDSNTGWAVGFHGELLKTTNGGEDWISKSSGTTGSLESVYFVDDSIGWITGSAPILKTTDGGENWTTQSNYGGLSLFFIDKLTGWVVRYDSGSWGAGKIRKTTNGGQSWTVQIEFEKALSSIYFVDSNNGWAVGGTGSILKTTNSGNTWLNQNSGIAENLVSVHFTNNSEGWAIGENGIIINTTNGGANWFQQSATSNNLNDIFFSDDKTGWIAGIDGTILKTTNGGVTFVNEEILNLISTDYNLFQNYPNPFNPATTIKYSIPQSTNVVIKVFDILGNEIETLVNEAKTTGTYEITWYAGNFPSGVYFYQLKADNYVETKKMILIK